MLLTACEGRYIYIHDICKTKKIPELSQETKDSLKKNDPLAGRNLRFNKELRKEECE